jgi:hypothetical protein
MTKRAFVYAILAVWIAVWIVFLVRPYFKKGLLAEYPALWGLSAEGKRAYVTGTDLYDFLKFAAASMGQASTYTLVGLSADSIDYRRAVYYLYPNVESPDPEYILVYNKGNLFREGYGAFKRLSEEKYILRKAF